MIALEKFKKTLGSIAAKLTDDQIERIRIIEDRIADAAFDAWLKKRNDPKGSKGVLTKGKDGGTV